MDNPGPDDLCQIWTQALVMNMYADAHQRVSQCGSSLSGTHYHGVDLQAHSDLPPLDYSWIQLNVSCRWGQPNQSPERVCCSSEYVGAEVCVPATRFIISYKVVIGNRLIGFSRRKLLVEETHGGLCLNETKQHKCSECSVMYVLTWHLLVVADI